MDAEKIEKLGTKKIIIKKCLKILYVIHKKASIHTGQKCGPIEKIQIGMLDGGAMELSEICSTCISTVRHTGQEMWTCYNVVLYISIYSTGFDIKIRKMCAFLKDPYEHARWMPKK